MAGARRWGTGGYYLLSDTDGPLVVVPIVALYAIAAQGRLQAAVAMAAAMVIGMSAGTFAGTIDINGTAVFMLAGRRRRARHRTARPGGLRRGGSTTACHRGTAAYRP
ncbi:hypothetical protein OIE52_46285 [Streptomyces canus]|uniref:hypothetical protein n=1 Tax=Streptomyces canus TaxID=58343 RepID=UPI002E2A0C95|nr:hypothetical protein [Streptomyces canus]